jgi:hypothetical protein
MTQRLRLSGIVSRSDSGSANRRRAAHPENGSRAQSAPPRRPIRAKALAYERLQLKDVLVRDFGPSIKNPDDMTIRPNRLPPTLLLQFLNSHWTSADK